MIGLVLLLILWILFTITSRRKKNEPAMYSGALPFVGHAYQLFGDREALWHQLKAVENEVLKKGPLMFQLGWKKCYVVGDAESFQAIATSCFNKSELVYKYTNECFGDCLLNAKVSIWQSHRKLLNPLFSQQILDNHIHVFNKQASLIVDELTDTAGNGYFDVIPYLQKTTLQTIFLTMVGVDIDEGGYNQKDYTKAMKSGEDSIIERVKRIWLFSDYLYSKSSFKNKYTKSYKIMHSFIDKLVSKRELAYEAYKNGDKSMVMNKTLLDMLLQLDNDNITTKDIRNEINSTIIAGYDTSSITLTYVLVMIGSHPDVQNRALLEIQEICPEGVISRQTISRLQYMKAVIKETIRVVNVISLIPRYLDKNIELKNYTLYKGHDCILLPNVLHRQSVWGDDADVFKPERWLQPTQPDATTLPAFAGFGYGKRNCIGKNYAIMYVAVILVHILRRYRVTAQHKDVVNYIGVTIKPISGHYISLENRK